RLDAERPVSIRVWQSLPANRADELRGLGIASGFGNPRLKLGYLKVFMDGTLGSQTARLLDGSGVEITSREEFADLICRAARERVRVSLALGLGSAGCERLGRADRRARPARRDQRGSPAHARRAAAVAPRTGPRGRAGAAGLDGQSGLARRRREAPRQAASRV